MIYLIDKMLKELYTTHILSESEDDKLCFYFYYSIYIIVYHMVSFDFYIISIIKQLPIISDTNEHLRNEIIFLI